MKHLSLKLEKLEERIAPGCISIPKCGGGGGSKHGGSKSHGSKGGGGSKAKGSKCK